MRLRRRLDVDIESDILADAAATAAATVETDGFASDAGLIDAFLGFLRCLLITVANAADVGGPWRPLAQRGVLARTQLLPQVARACKPSTEPCLDGRHPNGIVVDRSDGAAVVVAINLGVGTRWAKDVVQNDIGKRKKRRLRVLTESRENVR